MRSLVLMRHGQSVWNREDLFTGWTDVDLTDQGVAEARHAARLLAEGGYVFDVAFTSTLKRAIKTLHLTLEAMDLLWIPERKSWRLNERHYGALQGLNKTQTAEKYGKEQVFVWRRSWDVPPPPLEREDKRFPGHDPRYADVSDAELPVAESLKDTVARVIPYWEQEIAPALKAGQRVIVAAHGNSLRGLVKYLDDVADADIPGFELPTGKPLVYELTDDLKPTRRFFLDEDLVHGGRAPSRTI